MTEAQIQFWLEQLEKLANSYGVLNDEVGQLYSRVAVLETQVADLRRMSWVILGIVATTVIGALLNLVVNYKNSKNNK